MYFVLLGSESILLPMYDTDIFQNNKDNIMLYMRYYQLKINSFNW